MAGLSAVGAEFDIGAYGLGGSDGEVTPLDGGGYLVTWSNTVSPFIPIDGVTDTNGSTILARFLKADGSPAGAAFQVNTTEEGFQSKPEITQLAGGNVVIAWTSLGLDGNGEEAFARVYDSSGKAVSDEFLLHSDSTDDQHLPEITATLDGGFLATWLDERTTQTFDSDVYGQRFNADGSTNGVEFTAWNSSGSDITRHETLVFDDGSIRIVTEGPLVKSDGSFLDPYPALNASSTINSYFATNFYFDAIRLAGKNDGRFAMAGAAEYSPSEHTYTISFAVRDTSDYDNPVMPPDSSDYTVSDDIFTSEAQNMVGIDMAALDDGGFVVTWAYLDIETHDFNVMAQLYDADLGRVGDNLLVHKDVADNQSAPFVTQGEDGKILIGWTDDRTTVFAITGRLFDAGSGGGTGSSATEGADVLTGTAGKDRIDGLGGDDTISGAGGTDKLIGGKGDDRLMGEAGRDKLLGGGGKDTLLGGAGNDRLLGGAGKDVLKDTKGDNILKGGGGRDRLLTGKGDDRLDGGNGNDVLKSKGGADTLDGGHGDDLLIGGSGADVFAFGRRHSVDTIRDFAPGHDKIDLTDLKLDFGDLRISRVDGDTIIETGTGEIHLDDLLPKQIDEGDFLL